MQMQLMLALMALVTMLNPRQDLCDTHLALVLERVKYYYFCYYYDAPVAECLCTWHVKVAKEFQAGKCKVEVEVSPLFFR